MSASAPRTESGAHTPRQEELLDLALALVREVGLAGLTVRKLAERAGFTEAALYRHFHNKQALLLAMVARVSEERLLGPLRAIATDRERTARERLAAVVRHHVSTILALEGLPVLILAEAAAAGDEALLARFRTIVSELGGIYAGLIVEAGAPGEPSVEALGVVLIGIGAATALQYRLGASRAVQREVRDELPAFLVERLLGPEPGRPRQPATQPPTAGPASPPVPAPASPRKRPTERRR
ncbi:MAG TPA: TetR/AcrR family transcriptional regulator [Thermoanaerobaculia bacterium]|nr:TetR/AcrR family transcriptional regulator [Thermoanaerobaculia bacterium]